MRYFLNTTSLGDSKTAWIELGGFDYGAEIPTKIDSKGATFDPLDFGALSVSLLDSEKLAVFLQQTALGTVQSDAFIIGETDTGERVINISLKDVLFTSLIDTELDVTNLQLDYGAIKVETFTPNRDGGLNSDFAFQWDAANNDGDPGPFKAIPGFAAAAKGGSADFFMLVDDTSGNSADPNHKNWFDVAEFMLPVSNPDGSSSSFGNLTVTVESDSALTILLNKMQAGTLLDGVLLQGVDGLGGKNYELSIGGAFITSITDNYGPGYDVSFGYDVIKMEAWDSAGVPASAFSFDLGSGTAGGTIPTLNTGSNRDTAAAKDYFFAMTGYTGDVSDPTHKAWFAVDLQDFNLSRQSPLDPLNLPLIDLHFQTDAGLGKFMLDAAMGTEIKFATIHGVSLGNTVYNLDLGEVTVASVSETSDGGFNVLLDYDQIELTTKGFNASNALVTNPVFSWNKDTDTTVTVASAAPKVKTPVNEFSPAKYYMVVDQMNGGLQDPDHKNWFEISGFSGGMSNFGSPEFDDLHVEFASDTGYNGMLKALALGTGISGVRIQGVVDDGGIEKKVYDLGLSTVALSGLEDHTGAGFSADFDYQKIALRSFDPFTGKAITATGWDRLLNVSDSTLPAAKALGGRPDGSASEYFVAFGTSKNSVQGNSIDDNHKGWTDVVDIQFSASRATTLGVAGGKPDFSQVILTLDSDTPLAQLMGTLISGKQYDLVTIDGERDGGVRPSQQLVSNFTLKDVVVTDVKDLAGPGMTVTLEFGSFQHKANRIDPVTGKLGAENTFGWSQVTNKEVTFADKVEGRDPFPSRLPEQHYMSIFGLYGGNGTEERGGWFDITDFSFGGENRATVDNSGVSVGKFTAGPLTVHINTDHGLTDVMDFMTNRLPLQALSIEGTALDKNSVEKVVQTLSFGDVYVTGVTDTAGPGYDVTFAYSRFTVETSNINNGTTVTKMGWDITKSASFTGVIAASPFGTASNDHLAGSRFDNLMFGGDGKDDIRGFDGNDELWGDAKNDRLFGGNGDDKLIGGAGADSLRGDNGTDTAAYGGSDAGVTVSLASGTGTGGHAQGDVLFAIENVTGSALDDALSGDDKANTLLGTGGNDRLFGDLGADLLNGGADQDIYDYNSAADSTAAARDTIELFEFDVDRIDLQDVFAGTLFWIGAGGTISGVGQVTTIAAPDNPDLDTIILVNTEGDTTPEMEIRVNGQNFSQFLDVDFLL